MQPCCLSHPGMPVYRTHRVFVVFLVVLSGCAQEGAAREHEALAVYGSLATLVLEQPVEIEARPDGSVAVLRESTASASPTLGRVLQREVVVLGAEPGAVTLNFDGLPPLVIHEEDNAGPAQRMGGAITRRRTAGRVYWTLAPGGGAEEWLDLDEGVAFADRAVARWTVDGATLRELPAGGGVHVLGDDGEPIVHVSAPLARTHDGEDVVAHLRVETQAITLYVDANGRRVLVDPLWVPTGSMLTARALDEGPNIAVELGGGIVWAGGTGVGRATLRSVERYDSATGVWTFLPDLPRSRTGHVTAALPDGRLFAFGGYDDGGAIYDPGLGSWSVLAPLTGTRRSGARATSLADGRVLVSGGWTGTGYADPAQMFDPATDTWASAGSIGMGRYWHAATRLSDGRVLIAGGTTYSGFGDPRFNARPTATARVYDPTTGGWSSAGTLSQPRSRPRAVLLQTGHVLVAGGVAASGSSFGPSSAADLYDPVTGGWSPTGSLGIGRDYHSLTLLPDGRVLAAGGLGPAGVLATTEIYSLATGTWTSGPALRMPRADHASALLPDGRVLVAGGATGPGRTDGITNTSEILVEDTCGDGVLQAGEGCDDGNNANGDCCSAACTVEVAGTVCRAGTGCDAAETCDGASPSCPADVLAPAGVVCRAAAGSCDLPEQCDGTSPLCPPDALASAGVECRASASECDIAETCSGTSPSCPPDAARPEGSVCGSTPSGDCDAADACVGLVGASARCEARYAPAGTTCRGAVADCDLAEACTGASALCPADAVQGAGVVCRPAAGDCDIAETCTGTSPSCPTDVLSAPGAVCRPAAGDCDLPESCSGSSAACPPDAFSLAGAVCRPSAGACDVAEACTGTSAACPVDAVATAGRICREAVGECDILESCDGANADCPPDLARPGGSSCGPSPSGDCDAADECVGLTGSTARCEARVAPRDTVCRTSTCLDGVETSTASCDGASPICPRGSARDCAPFACGRAECLTSCTDESECAPGWLCLRGGCEPQMDAGSALDAGMLDGGITEHPDATLPDASNPVDAAMEAGLDSGPGIDAAPTSPPTASCGCRVASPDDGGLWMLSILLLLGLLARRRRIHGDREGAPGIRSLAPRSSKNE